MMCYWNDGNKIPRASHVLFCWIGDELTTRWMKNFPNKQIRLKHDMFPQNDWIIGH
jgi:hypothetical protein